MTDALLKIWDKTIGAVSWREEEGYAEVEFTADYLGLNWNLSPLKMPASQTGSVFRFPALGIKRSSDLDTFKGLPGLLADSLPDRFGKSIIDAWLARQGRAYDSLNPVELLCFIGARGMGALEFEPNIETQTDTSSAIEMSSIVATARDLLNQKAGLSTNLKNEEQAILDILRVGTSAGGARPKAVIAWNPKTNDIRSGQSNVPKGYEHWLIKLDGVSDVQLGDYSGYGRVEMAYYEMAIAAGVEMMPCRLLEENGRAHFITQRFDRTAANVKHHVQTWCAMEHFDYNLVGEFSYEILFQTMRKLGLPYPAAVQLFKRMVFNVIARNCDDHTKNFAFLFKKDLAKWELAPAYDICYAYSPGNKWISKHAISINGKRDAFDIQDLLSVAATIGCNNARQIITEINDVVQDWSTFSKQYEVDKQKSKAIQSSLLKF